VAKNPPEFRRLLRSSGAYFVTVGAFSLTVNLLYLAGPLYMLQLYDRVVPSGSKVTLLMLTLALLLAYLALAGLNVARACVLTRASVRLDQRIAPEIMTAIRCASRHRPTRPPRHAARLAKAQRPDHRTRNT
jgi:ATP-binding cassette, subfamily C, bacterial